MGMKLNNSNNFRRSTSRRGGKAKHSKTSKNKYTNEYKGKKNSARRTNRVSSK